jgi:hypothetical protein
MCNCNKKEIDSESISLDYTLLSGLNSINIRFMYTGKTGLTIKGGTTLLRYRFEKPGDIQLIDSHDIPGILHIPVLKRVR